MLRRVILLCKRAVLCFSVKSSFQLLFSNVSFVRQLVILGQCLSLNCGSVSLVSAVVLNDIPESRDSAPKKSSEKSCNFIQRGEWLPSGVESVVRGYPVSQQQIKLNQNQCQMLVSEERGKPDYPKKNLLDRGENPHLASSPEDCFSSKRSSQKTDLTSTHSF